MNKNIEKVRFLIYTGVLGLLCVSIASFLYVQVTTSEDGKEYQVLYQEIQKELQNKQATAKQKAVLLLEKSEKKGETVWAMKALAVLMRIANEERKIKDCEYYVSKSYKYTNNKTKSIEKVNIWLEKGFYYKNVYYNRHLDSAFFFYNKAQKMSEELGYFSGKYTANTFLAYLKLDNGKISEALHLFLAILQETEKSNDMGRKQNLYNNIGNIYNTIGLYQEAVAMFEKGYHVSQDEERRFLNKVNEAECLINMGNFDKSLNTLKRVENIASTIADTSYRLFYCHILVQAYNGTKKYEKALHVFQEADKLKYQLDPVLRNLLTAQKAKALMGLKDALVAHEVMLKIEKELIQDKDFGRYATLDGLQVLMHTYQYLKDYPKAFYFAKRYQEYYAKFYNEKLSKDIYMKETKERIKLQEEKSALKEAILHEEILLFRLVVFILILFLAFAVYAIGQKTRYGNKLTAKNNIIQEQNIILINQKEEIEIQNEQLIIQSEQLEEANETKDKLFAILGHDLRSPIGSLESVLNLMNMGIVSYEEFQKIMPQFHKNVKNMQATLENLLQWSVTQMQGITANSSNVNITQIVEDKLQLFGEIAKTKNITLAMDIPQGTMAWADENHVRLLFRNLINNAIKFTPEAGKIIISAYEQDAKIIVNVVDNGVGMTKERVEKLFKKNLTFTTYGTGGEKGTGLGLQLCQEIVTKNRGEIWATSEEGKGSTFSFSLPTSSMSLHIY